jgi:uncharacterized protein
VSETLLGLSSGRLIDLAAPSDWAGSVTAEEIAHGLSTIARFGGQASVNGAPVIYTVAQHSVHVAQFLKDEGYVLRTQYAGLLHDAPEAFLGDMTTPLKNACGGEYCGYYAAVERGMLTAHGVILPLPVGVGTADKALFGMEASVLLSGQARDKFCGSVANSFASDIAHPWEPRYAMVRWLGLYQELRDAIWPN